MEYYNLIFVVFYLRGSAITTHYKHSLAYYSEHNIIIINPRSIRERVFLQSFREIWMHDQATITLLCSHGSTLHVIMIKHFQFATVCIRHQWNTFSLAYMIIHNFRPPFMTFRSRVNCKDLILISYFSFPELLNTELIRRIWICQRYEQSESCDLCER